MTETAFALHCLPRVGSLADGGGDAVQVFAEAQRVGLPAPLFVEQLEPLSALTQDIIDRRFSDIDAMYLARLHDATVTGSRDIVTADGVFLADLRDQAGLHGTPPVAPAVPDRVRRIEQSCGFLFHNASCGTNHSHWLLQALPQLAYWERAGVRPERLVVQPTIRPYQRDVLAGLGYGEETLLIRHPDEPMRFRTLYAGYVDGGLVPDPTIYDRLITAFDRDEPGPAKVYVSRQDARGIRRLLNEAALIARLRAEGFTILVPGALSVAAEVALFRQARLIVGPLGAGLYNALLTKPGAVIVALSDPFYAMEWLAQVAALRGHRVGWVFGLAFESVEPIYGGTHNNWLIDVDRTAAALSRLEKAPALRMERSDT